MVVFPGHQGSGSWEECVSKGKLCAAANSPDMAVAETVVLLLPLVAGMGCYFMGSFGDLGWWRCCRL